MTAGLDLRHEGQAANLAADQAAHRGYGDLVRDVIEDMAPGAEFTADTVRLLVKARAPYAEPHHPNVLPSIFGVPRNAGVMERLPREVNSTRATRHGSRNPVYHRT